MNKLKKSELANAFNVKQNVVSNWIKRNNIIIDADGLIDIRDPKNKVFIDKKVITGMPFDLNRANMPPEERHKIEDAEIVIPANDLAKMQRTKLANEIKRQEKAIKLDQLKIDKMEGVLIPTDAATHLFINAVTTMRSQYLQSVEAISNVLKERLECSHEMFIEIKKDLREIVEVLQQEIKKELLDGLDDIVEEYKDVRGRGEKR